MCNRYNIKMIQRGFDVFKNIIAAYRFLMEVDNLSELDLCNDFCIIDDAGNRNTASATIDDDRIIFSFDAAGVIVDNNELIYSECLYDDSGHKIKFIVKNPKFIVNEETFFQASMLYDLSDVKSYEWFVTIMQTYDFVMDFMKMDFEQY